MKSLLKQLEALRKQVAELEPASAYTGNAAAALSAARDNLEWELDRREVIAKQLAEEAKQTEPL